MPKEKTAHGVEVPNVVPATPDNPPAQATTTSEEDLHSKSQRKVNLIWEFTQAAIALMVTIATLFVAARLGLKGDGGTAAFLLLSNAFFLVVGFYFGRTNHQKVGGVQIGR